MGFGRTHLKNGGRPELVAWGPVGDTGVAIHTIQNSPLMRLLQHNCRKTYAVTVAALEAGLELGVGLACLQEPYVDMEFRHGGYQMDWPEAGSLRARRVAIAIRRDLLDKVIVEARTDLLDHPYFMVMDVWELNRAREKVRRTQTVDRYDN